MAIETEGMSLSNLAEGQVETAFQEMLTKVIDLCAEAEAFEPSGGIVTFEIPISVYLYYHLKDATLMTGGRVNMPKTPKRTEVKRIGWIRDGEVLVEKAKQQELFDGKGKVTPIREGGEE